MSCRVYQLPLPHEQGTSPQVGKDEVPTAAAVDDDVVTENRAGPEELPDALDKQVEQRRPLGPAPVVATP